MPRLFRLGEQSPMSTDPAEMGVTCTECKRDRQSSGSTARARWSVCQSRTWQRCMRCNGINFDNEWAVLRGPSSRSPLAFKHHREAHLDRQMIVEHLALAEQHVS